MTKLVESDHLQTPGYILDRVRAFGHIALDPCGNEASRASVNAWETFTLDDGRDGLKEDWTAYVAGPPPALAFVNPPYSRGHLGPWTSKIAASFCQGVEVVSLLPLDPTTKWWALMMSTGAARVMINHRVQFAGGFSKAGMIRSVLFYHGWRPWLFLHYCGVMGEKTLLGGGG